MPKKSVMRKPETNRQSDSQGGLTQRYMGENRSRRLLQDSPIFTKTTMITLFRSLVAPVHAVELEIVN